MSKACLLSHRPPYPVATQQTRSLTKIRSRYSRLKPSNAFPWWFQTKPSLHFGCLELTLLPTGLLSAHSFSHLVTPWGIGRCPWLGTVLSLQDVLSCVTSSQGLPSEAAKEETSHCSSHHLILILCLALIIWHFLINWITVCLCPLEYKRHENKNHIGLSTITSITEETSGPRTLPVNIG